MHEVAHEQNPARQLSDDLYAVVAGIDGGFTDGEVQFGNPESESSPWMRVQFKNREVQTIVFNDSVRTENATTSATMYYLSKQDGVSFTVLSEKANLVGVSLTQGRTELTLDNAFAAAIKLHVSAHAARNQVTVGRYEQRDRPPSNTVSQVGKNLGSAALACLRQTVFYKIMAPGYWASARRMGKE